MADTDTQDATDTDADGTQDTNDSGPPDYPEGLGDAGKKALDQERHARREADANLRKLQAELEELRKTQMTEQEKAIEAAKAEGRTEAEQAANERLVRAEVKLAAAGKLADPADAVRLLDLSKFSVDAKGDVNSKAIAEAIEALVKDKPYLAAAGARPGPLPGGGARPTGGANPIDDAIRRAAGR